MVLLFEVNFVHNVPFKVYSNDNSFAKAGFNYGNSYSSGGSSLEGSSSGGFRSWGYNSGGSSSRGSGSRGYSSVGSGFGVSSHNYKNNDAVVSGGFVGGNVIGKRQLS